MGFDLGSGLNKFGWEYVQGAWKGISKSSVGCSKYNCECTALKALLQCSILMCCIHGLKVSGFVSIWLKALMENEV